LKIGPIFKNLLGACALLTGLGSALTAQAGSEQGRVLIYWSAGDCGPCLAWSKTERKQEFLVEAQRLGFQLVEVQRPRVADPLTRYAWPVADAALAERYQHYPPAAMTPAFDLVCRGELVKRMDGLADWDSFWKTSMRALAKTCDAAPT
jgi:hypothetical protein